MTKFLHKKHRAVSTVVGGFIFLILLVAALTGIIVYLQLQFDIFNITRDVADLQIQKIREDFDLTAACVDPFNNRLFIEVQNTGSIPVEIVDLFIVNRSGTNPVSHFDIDYRDSFVPFGFNGSILVNQPLIMTPGIYDLKIVSALGQMDVIVNKTIVAACPGGGPGTLLFEFDPNQVKSPEGLWIENGLLYVASEHTHEVLRYNPITGDFVDVFVSAKAGGLEKPIDLAFGPDGNLYVTSEKIDKVFRFNGTTGAFIDYFVTDGNIDTLSGLAFDPAGNFLFVADEGKNRVNKYNATNGDFIEVFITGQISKPKWLKFGPNGNLFVSSEGNDKIIEFDGSNGNHVADIISKSGGKPDHPEGIRFGPDGNLYVSSEKTDEILRYDGTTFDFIDVFVSNDDSDFFCDEPADLIFNANGDLIVACEKADKILAFVGPLSSSSVNGPINPQELVCATVPVCDNDNDKDKDKDKDKDEDEDEDEDEDKDKDKDEDEDEDKDD